MLIKIVKHSRVLSCLFRSGENLMHFHGGMLWWLLTPSHYSLLHFSSAALSILCDILSSNSICSCRIARLLPASQPAWLPAWLHACLCRLPLKMQARWQSRGVAPPFLLASLPPWSIIYIVVGIEKWMGIENAKGFPSCPLPLRVEAPFIHVTCLLSFWFLARLFICFQTDCIIITQLFWVL